MQRKPNFLIYSKLKACYELWNKCYKQGHKLKTNENIQNLNLDLSMSKMKFEEQGKNRLSLTQKN